MSLDKKRVIINTIKEYLETWIELERIPNQFDEKSTTNMDDKSVVYFLGSSLYLALTNEPYTEELTHRNIRQPRIYQFLQRVLLIDKESRESNPKILLEILEEDEVRDLIENKKAIDNYTLECFSSVGLTRLRNQDYLGCYQFDNATLLIVADGVGGANGGEIASKITTDFVIESLKKHDLSTIDISETLRDIVFDANQEVLSYAKQHDMGQMGTTLSIALILNQKKLYIAHVGDSRIYEFNGLKKPRQITEDHSEVEILYRTEVITKEDKKNYKKNILRYAIGLERLKKENIFVQFSYISGDINLLLCSDGLWEQIDIDKGVFNKNFDDLKEDIFNSIPSDNVTFIRYHAVAKMEESFELAEIPFEEEFEANSDEEKCVPPQQKFKKISKKGCQTIKRTSSIEKINRLLLPIVSILLLSVALYFAIENNVTKKIDFNKTTVLPIEQNISIKDKNITDLDTKNLKKQKLQEEIDKTQLKLDRLKAEYQGLLL